MFGTSEVGDGPGNLVSRLPVNLRSWELHVGESLLTGSDYIPQEISMADLGNWMALFSDKLEKGSYD